MTTPYERQINWNMSMRKQEEKEKAAAAPEPQPVAWLISWFEAAHPCSMVTVDDPGPADPDETIAPLYATPVDQSARIALLEGFLREWLDGEYDGQDYLRRVRLALHKSAPVAALGEG